MSQALLFIQIPILALSLYWLAISLFGLRRVKPLKISHPFKRFAILVPAHNEEAVIGSLVDSLMNLDYPKELYTVFVIADSCSDQTATIARQHGAIALEHTYLPGEVKGKPQAIAWALEQFDLNDYDAVAVFDADNLVSANFLSVMNTELLNGGQLIQAYLDSKNPNDSWVTSGYSVSYYYMNRSWQLARQNLGLGAAIGGTGFCVDARLLQEIGWTARTLTEDLEFQMQCLLRDVRARFTFHARVWDEKPLDLKPSMVQRLRWARGHWQVCLKYAAPLMKKAIRDRDLAAFDGVIYLLNPGKIVIGGLISTFMGIQFIAELVGLTGHWVDSLLPWPIWASMLLFQVAYLMGSVWKDSNVKPRPAQFVHLMLMNLTYVPLAIQALVTYKSRSWNPTKHTRSITSDQVRQTVA